MGLPLRALVRARFFFLFFFAFGGRALSTNLDRCRRAANLAWHINVAHADVASLMRLGAYTPALSSPLRPCLSPSLAPRFLPYASGRRREHGEADAINYDPN